MMSFTEMKSPSGVGVVNQPGVPGIGTTPAYGCDLVASYVLTLS